MRYLKDQMMDYKSYDRLSSLKDNSTVLLPLLVIWTLRVLLAFQAYMYHKRLSILHLVWVILSFLLPIKVVLFISIMIMIPFYSFEVVMVYGIRIPKVDYIPIFAEYKSEFGFHMKYPMFEQFLFFFNLALLFLCIGCFKLAFQYDTYKEMNRWFRATITDRNTSIWWRFLFYILRYCQWFILVALFLKGSGNMNNFRNLSMMTFFILYTTSEQLYRKTGSILILFNGFFIISQYYWSLTYRNYQGNAALMHRAEWFGFFSSTRAYEWELNSEIYFRIQP